MNSNDANDPLPFIQLSAIVANVTRFLIPDEKQPVEREPERGGDAADEEKRKAHRDYVDRRLRDIAAFERRAAGIDKRFRRK